MAILGRGCRPSWPLRLLAGNVSRPSGIAGPVSAPISLLLFMLLLFMLLLLLLCCGSLGGIARSSRCGRGKGPSGCDEQFARQTDVA